METTESPAPQPLPKPRRRWLLMSLACTLILACGIVIGSVATTHLLWNRLVYNIQHPDNVPNLVSRHMRWRLGLDARQRQQLHAILEDHLRKMNAIRADARPRIVQELDQLRADISAMLTPDQATRWQEGFDRLRARLTPPPP